VGATVTMAFFIALTWVMPEHNVLPARLIVAAIVAFVQVACPLSLPPSKPPRNPVRLNRSVSGLWLLPQQGLLLAAYKSLPPLAWGSWTRRGKERRLLELL
jgi:hypothetical protein